VTGLAWTFNTGWMGSWSIGTPNLTSGGATATTTNAVTTLFWNVRLSDGSIVVMEGTTSMEAKAAVEAAEWARPAHGLPVRGVVEVTSA